MKYFKAVLFLFYYIVMSVVSPAKLKAENDEINKEVN